MNPWLWKFADGTAFFLGMAMVAAACTSQLWLSGGIWRSVANAVALVGAVFVGFSATPLPLFAYVVWAAALLGSLICVHVSWKTDRGRSAKRFTVAAVVVLSVVLCVLEARYRLAPSVRISSHTPVYVIGDSLSAGGVPSETSWPELLAGESGLQVTNLAKSGATIANGLVQAQRVPQQPGLVIVEIGGNDMFGPTTSRMFEQQLDRLLTTLAAGGHKILMFELPLPPLHNGFGQAQRRQARKHGAQLIPKRQLAGVVATPGATVDGLHFSPEGHQMMASQVRRLIQVE